MHQKLYVALAQAIDARKRCRTGTRTHDKLMTENWDRRIAKMFDEHMPRGSGIDNGCKLDDDASSGEKIVILTSYHHMDENGVYDGWTEHKITVRPSLMFGFVLTVSGRDRNLIRDYLADVFASVLNHEGEFLG